VEDEWEDFEAKPEFIDRGDHLVTAVRISGRARGGGVEVEMRLFNVWTLRDGRALRIITGGYRERVEALEAAGQGVAPWRREIAAVGWKPPACRIGAGGQLPSAASTGVPFAIARIQMQRPGRRSPDALAPIIPANPVPHRQA
jgi:hypothetical protein